MTNHVGVYACVVMLIVQNGKDFANDRLDWLCYLKGIFNGCTVYYEIQVGLWAFKTLLALQTYVTSIIITTMN